MRIHSIFHQRNNNRLLPETVLKNSQQKAYVCKYKATKNTLVRALAHKCTVEDEENQIIG